MTAVPNEYGVFVDGVEVITLSDRGKKQKAAVRIAEHAGRFFWGVDVAYGGLSVGGRRFSFLPMRRGPHPPQRSKESALLAARRFIADIVYEAEGVPGAWRCRAVHKHAAGILKDVEPMVQIELFKQKRRSRCRKK